MLVTNSVHNPKLTLPSMFKIYEQLDRALEQASEKRREIFTELKLRPWFLNTDPKLHVELANLPAGPECNSDEFLEQLSRFPEEVSNGIVMSLERLFEANLSIMMIFSVKNHTGAIFTSGHTSLSLSSLSGTKELVPEKPEKKKSQPPQPCDCCSADLSLCDEDIVNEW